MQGVDRIITRSSSPLAILIFASSVQTRRRKRYRNEFRRISTRGYTPGSGGVGDGQIASRRLGSPEPGFLLLLFPSGSEGQRPCRSGGPSWARQLLFRGLVELNGFLQWLTSGTQFPGRELPKNREKPSGFRYLATGNRYDPTQFPGLDYQFPELRFRFPWLIYRKPGLKLNFPGLNP
jgi:hypothetical protein